MAMRWFTRQRPQEIWDQPMAGPLGDIEAAHRIRDICRSAADSAEKCAAVQSGGGKKSDDAERYERGARAAMEITMKISDDLLRDSSVQRIIDLCLKANDLRTARILFRAIQAPSIREEVMRDHPDLG